MTRRLKDADMRVLVFGGWAEEFAGVIAPRPHKDLDLLYIADSFSSLDAFLNSQEDCSEIQCKHFSHKRAFVYEGVMVELMLLERSREGNFSTNFWNAFILQWPRFSPVSVRLESGYEVDVVPASLVAFYRSRYAELDVLRQKYIG